MRGLKQDRFEPEENLFVASFTDAWIETHHLLCNLPLKVVASFTDAWIETYLVNSVIPATGVASFTDAWIETPLSYPVHILFTRRIFYRCVD